MGGVSTIVLAFSPRCWHKVPLKHAVSPVPPPGMPSYSRDLSSPPSRRAEVRSLTRCCLLINEKPEISPPGTAPRPHLTPPAYRPRRGRAPGLGHVELCAALWLTAANISYFSAKPSRGGGVWVTPPCASPPPPGCKARFCLLSSFGKGCGSRHVSGRTPGALRAKRCRGCGGTRGFLGCRGERGDLAPAESSEVLKGEAGAKQQIPDFFLAFPGSAAVPNLCLNPSGAAQHLWNRYEPSARSGQRGRCGAFGRVEVTSEEDGVPFAEAPCPPAGTDTPAARARGWGRLLSAKLRGKSLALFSVLRKLRLWEPPRSPLGDGAGALGGSRAQDGCLGAASWGGSLSGSTRGERTPSSA